MNGRCASPCVRWGSRLAACALAVMMSVATTAASAPELSAQSAPGERPRVGLVLSGGGARGFAHLGVLEVLHDLRVPIDAIAGTSMGAVVGGLFATGIPYPELARLFEREDWGAIFDDDPPRREWPMRRKRLDREQLMGLEIGVGLDGIKLPEALLAGAKLNNALRAYAFPARGVGSFDDLPIPFRAVATDVEDGSMIVLESGDLADAIRASMAVPEAFAPQTIDGRRLVDGGLVRNIPVDVARELGVDVLIVSDVTTSIDEAPDASDPLTLASRLVTVITWAPSRDQLELLEEADVYVRPDLTEIPSSDFSLLEAAVEAGSTAAEAQAGRLAALSVSEAEYDALTRARADGLPALDTIVPVRVVVDTTATTLNEPVIREVVDIDVGEPLSLLDLRRDLTRALGYGGFVNISFSATEDSVGEVLRIRPVDKPWGPVLARAGLSLSDRQRGTGGWSLRGVFDWTRLTSGGGEARLEVELGTRHGLRGWVQIPLSPSERTFLTADADLGRREIFPQVEGLPIGLDLTERELFAGFGVRLGWWGDAVVGVKAGDYSLVIPEAATPGESSLAWDERSVELRLEADILDRVDFPSSGARGRLVFAAAGDVLGGSDTFEQLELDWLGALSSGHQTFELSGLIATGFGSEVPLYRSQPLGGYDRLTGVDRESVWGPYAGLVKFRWSFRFDAPATAPGGGLRVGFSLEGGQAWATSEAVDLSFDAFDLGASIWAGLATPLGPIRLAYAGLQGRKPTWVVQFGATR